MDNQELIERVKEDLFEDLNSETERCALMAHCYQGSFVLNFCVDYEEKMSISEVGFETDMQPKEVFSELDEHLAAKGFYVSKHKSHDCCDGKTIYYKKERLENGYKINLG